MLRGLQRWNRFQFLQKCFYVFGLGALNGADDNIFTAFVAASCFIKHSIGLSNSRRVTKKNLEACAPALVLFGLHLLEKPLRTWSNGIGYAHF